MRKVFTFLVPMAIGILLTATVWAQSPEKMSYQAVIRDASDNLVTSQAVGMQISILQGSASGTAVYVETQTPTSNANGLVSLEIGSGTPVTGTFATIDWANGPYFIKTETDPAGGTSYSITGTSQLLSVPYALHAKTAETVTGGITESQITDLQDYATKAYVDQSAPATYEIGDEAHGGIVFYVESCGTKGLVAATEDQSTDIKWRGGSTNYATMAMGGRVYAGKMNTSIIIAVHSAKNDFDDHAALVCANYTGGDFGNWYLPSKEELLLMYNNLHKQSLGGFANERYWSSSEYEAPYAYNVTFLNGTLYASLKYYTYRVRAVRAF